MTLIIEENELQRELFDTKQQTATKEQRHLALAAHTERQSQSGRGETTVRRTPLRTQGVLEAVLRPE